MKLDVLLVLPFLAVLSACDRLVKPSYEPDRSAAYRAAMADYSAGRMDAAIRGFEKAIAANPANASARFQLACVLQDVRHDYLGALCEFREYLRLCPESDKTSVATERFALCERLAAPGLAKKAGILGSEAAAEEQKRLTDENARLTKDVADLRARLFRAEERAERLAKDNERARAMLVAPAGEEESTEKPTAPVEADLLDEEDPVKGSAHITTEVQKLIREEREERPETATTPFAVAEKKPEESEKPVRTEPPHEERPATYVVQEGDTLYKLALRFYGRKSAYKLIQSANRAVISTDYRIYTGQKLVLPDLSRKPEPARP